MLPWIIVGGVVLFVYMATAEASPPVLSDAAWGESQGRSGSAQGEALQRGVNTALGHIERAMAVSRAIESEGLSGSGLVAAWTQATRGVYNGVSGSEVFPRLAVDGIVGPHTRSMYSVVFGIVQGAATGIADISVDLMGPVRRYDFEKLVEGGSEITVDTVQNFNSYMGRFPDYSIVTDFVLYVYIGDMGRQMAADDEMLAEL
jgi:hypothetical protein